MQETNNKKEEIVLVKTEESVSFNFELVVVFWAHRSKKNKNRCFLSTPTPD